MKRVPENNGVYIECPAEELASRMPEAENAQIVVVTEARIELAGEDKNQFLKKFAQVVAKTVTDDLELSSEQLSRIAFREMLFAEK